MRFNPKIENKQVSFANANVSVYISKDFFILTGPDILSCFVGVPLEVEHYETPWNTTSFIYYPSAFVAADP